MFASVRHYTPTTGSVTKSDFDALKQRIENEFVPLIQDVPGFHCYYAVNVDDRELVTISLFETRAGATESTRRAADYVKNDPLRDRLSTPEVLEGELMVAKEAPVGAH